MFYEAEFLYFTLLVELRTNRRVSMAIVGHHVIIC